MTLEKRLAGMESATSVALNMSRCATCAGDIGFVEAVESASSLEGLRRYANWLAAGAKDAVE